MEQGQTIPRTVALPALRRRPGRLNPHGSAVAQVFLHSRVVGGLQFGAKFGQVLRQNRVLLLTLLESRRGGDALGQLHELADVRHVRIFLGGGQDLLDDSFGGLRHERLGMLD